MSIPGSTSINVTQPYLPPLDEFIPYLREIWDAKWLTNNGDFHQTFEKELAAFLGVEYLSLFTNGTLALVTALQALRISGEVITTPYSFVATTHALNWNGIRPVFVDIEPTQLNLDATKIEAAITPHTTAILPVHVYGNPCDVSAIQSIADTYGLKVIYDAAHAFGVRENGIPIVNHGDLSILSFHATKVFNTFEGGAIICHDAVTKKRIDYLKNFGIANETTVIGPGINAKMSEFQAALGVVQLKHIKQAISKRKEIFWNYWRHLKGIPGITMLTPKNCVDYNYAYLPVLIDQERFGCSRDDVYDELRRVGILARRYFYPLISQFPSYRDYASSAPHNLIVAEDMCRKILCLPIFPDLSSSDYNRIISGVVSIQKKAA